MRRFCSRACYRRSRSETRPEGRAREALTGLDITFEQEAAVGRYVVDFILPMHQIALEIDGTYWHRDQARDDRKTAYLSSLGLRVVRINAEELMAAVDATSLITGTLQRGHPL
jgi:very-short-patch-repair endonuclease